MCSLSLVAVSLSDRQAFECIKHNPLLAKLDAYGFSHEAICLVNSSLENKQQRVKINGLFSTYKQFSLGVPQGSVIGPLFFHIYINDLLLCIQDTDICNYADDTTMYACDKNLDNVTGRFVIDSSTIIQWFADNYMKLNTDKCHLMELGRNPNQQVTAIIGNSVVKSTEEEKLLGVVIDKN